MENKEAVEVDFANTANFFVKYTQHQHGKDKICIIPPKFVLNTQKTKCLPKKTVYPQAKGYIQKNADMKLFLLFPKNQIP